jgi:hypothetical protein
MSPADSAKGLASVLTFPKALAERDAQPPKRHLTLVNPAPRPTAVVVAHPNATGAGNVMMAALPAKKRMAKATPLMKAPRRATVVALAR